MKKQLLSFYLCAFGILAFAQTTVSIPDDAFEAYLETTFASNITPDGSTTDGSITFVDIDLITDIDFPTGSVTTVADLTGVNSFPRLKNLYCQDNALTGTLDVSGLDQLTNLYCYNNIGLTDLDVSGCTKLYHVKAYGCGFTSLDFSAATLSASDPSRLRYVYVNDNALTSIDISGNTGIFRYDTFNNSLTSIDISGLTTLTYLRFNNNAVTGDIDVSANLGLEKLGGYGNDLSSIDLGAIPYTSFNYFKISSNPNLTCVYTDNPSDFEQGGALDTALGSNYSVDATTNFFVDASACAPLSVSKNEVYAYHVFPNPSNSILHVDTLKEVDFKLIDLKGQEISSGKINSENHSIDISTVSRGLYLIQLIDEEGNTSTKKIIKE